MTDLVLGLCTNFEVRVVEPFLSSLKALNADIRLVLFTANMSETFRAIASELGITTEDASPYLNLGYHPLNARFFMYRDYLARNQGDYAGVMLSDVRDVLFQSNPFAVPRDSELWFAAEDAPISAEQKWNARWLREIYGEGILEEIQHNPISCAGTTIGTSYSVQEYLNLMCMEMTTRPIDRTINYDQGIHNFIAWKVCPTWGRVDLEDRVVSTVNMTHRDHVGIRPDGIWIEGKRPPVVHQWDRQPILATHVEQDPRYRMALPQSNSTTTLSVHRSSDAHPYPTIESAITAFKNERKALGHLYNSFTQSMSNTPLLIRHREHVEQNRLGFGDRAFYWQWKLLVDAMPKKFNFLEIGVYKGQVISLIGTLAISAGKHANIVAVTPLDRTGDKYSTYGAEEYAGAIEEIQVWSGVPVGRRAYIIDGLSTDDAVKRRVRSGSPYNIVYIDGGHDFHVVVNDIVTYGEMVAPGGYIVMDDASSELDMPDGIWRGHADVGRAAREVLQPDCRFVERLAIGHLRTWQKLAGS